MFFYDEGFLGALASMRRTIAVSTYEASKAFSFWGDSKKVSMHESSIPRAMGVGFEGDMMAVAMQGGMAMYRKISKFRSVNEGLHYDHMWVARAKYLTGPIDTHDVAIHDRRIYAINTAWSCISIFGYEESFQPIWKPPFVQNLKPGDRCHLNGMAFVGEAPKYVTALGQTDEPKAWKATITSGGVLMDVQTNEVLLEGLGMPHSPVWSENDGCLHFLESAKGSVTRYTPETGAVETVIQTDRFLRGLAIHDGVAFVGFSKLRETSSTFQKLRGLLNGDAAGVLAIDLKQGQLLGTLQFEEGVDELYDVSFFPGEGRHVVLSERDALMKPHLVLKDKLLFMRRQGKEA